jgi:uncharacterized protein YodC (DUF2158 family)
VAYPVKTGDVVRLTCRWHALRAGGQKMTVTRVGDDEAGILTVWCTWFVGNEHKSTSFPAGALKIAERPSGNRMATSTDFDF